MLITEIHNDFATLVAADMRDFLQSCTCSEQCTLELREHAQNWPKSATKHLNVSHWCTAECLQVWFNSCMLQNMELNVTWKLTLWHSQAFERSYRTVSTSTRALDPQPVCMAWLQVVQVELPLHALVDRHKRLVWGGGKIQQASNAKHPLHSAVKPHRDMQNLAELTWTLHVI